MRVIGITDIPIHVCDVDEEFTSFITLSVIISCHCGLTTSTEIPKPSLEQIFTTLSVEKKTN